MDHCDLSEVAALAWAANIGALELHVTMGAEPDTTVPTAVVFDLDPGAPADVRTCAEVALRIREVLDGLGLRAYAKTSGSKGLQLYVPVHDPELTYDRTRDFSQAVAQLLETRLPGSGGVQAAQDAASRQGPHRLVPEPPHQDDGVRLLASGSAPPDRVDARDAGTRSPTRSARDEGALVFDLDDVRTRVAEHGDLFADVASLRQELPALGG